MNDRPLYMLDADEVLIAFIEPFADFLAEQGYRLELTSFALAGNICPSEGDSPCDEAEVARLLERYFEARCDHCEPIAGAVEAVRTLQSIGEVVVLTNVPRHLAERRRRALERIGIGAPVVANRGPKGRRARELSEGRHAPVAFVDDLPLHHSSVARHAPWVRRVHFLAHPLLRELAPPADDAEQSFWSWADCLAYLAEIH